MHSHFTPFHHDYFFATAENLKYGLKRFIEDCIEAAVNAMSFYYYFYFFGMVNGGKLNS